jgi:hypothetical protein
MPEPIFQRLAHRITPSSNSRVEVELGPFAISCLSIDVIRPQPAANAELTVTDIVSFITRISVFVRGVSLWDMSAVDSWVIGSAILGKMTPARKTSQGATTRRHVANIIIPFSRRFLMPVSGLPPIGRGEGLLVMEFGTVPSGAQVSVHAYGWKDHKPEWTLRCIRNTFNIANTGDADLIIALAGPLLGVAFYESNPMLNAATAILDNMRFLVQGVEDTFASVNLEGLLALQALTVETEIRQADHTHIENLAASYTQNATTLSRQSPDVLNAYTIVLLDEAFDPDAIIATPVGSVTSFRITASATGTIFVFPIEMITLPERPRPAGAPA